MTFVSAKREKIEQSQLQGFKYFKAISGMLDGLHNAGCQRDCAGNPNNLTGVVSIGISGRPDSIEQGFIYVDGELKGNIDYRLDPEITSEYALLDTFTIANGSHEIKAVVIDTNGIVTVSQKISVSTNNAIYHFVRADSFKQGEDYHLYAMNGSPDDLRVKLYNWDGTLAWTSASSSGNLNLSVPASTFTGEIYDMAVESSGGGWQEIWKEATGKKYDINGNYKVQVFLPNGKTPVDFKNVADSRQEAVAELVRWSRARGFTCAVWYLGQANWKTFSTQVTKANTKIIYIVSHGYATFEYKGTTTNRLNFLISSGWPGGWFGGTEYVLSHKEDIPGANTDSSVHSLRELGLAYTNHLRIIYHTACRMGQSNEMAREWIDLDLPLEQIFISFIGTVPTFSTNWQLWDYQVWNQWGDGQNRWFDVFDYCSRSINNPSGPQIAEQIGSYGDSQTRFN